MENSAAEFWVRRVLVLQTDRWHRQTEDRRRRVWRDFVSIHYGKLTLRAQTGSFPWRLIFLLLVIFFIFIIRIIHQTYDKSGLKGRMERKRKPLSKR